MNSGQGTATELVSAAPPEASGDHQAGKARDRGVAVPGGGVRPRR